MPKQDSYMKKYYSQLIGRTITSVKTPEGDFPVLVLDNGWKIQVSRDEEGNGPGFLFGLPHIT